MHCQTIVAGIMGFALVVIPTADARPRPHYIHLHPLIQHHDDYSKAINDYASQSGTTASYHDPENPSLACEEHRAPCVYMLASTETSGTDIESVPVPPQAPITVKTEPEGIGNVFGRGLARLKNGGVVVAWAKARFDAFFAEAAKLGYPAGELRGACYSRGGHQSDSKHHWGGACDGWGQYARGRMHRRHMPPSMEIQLARKHGLESGCEWHHDRRGPDCGHIQVQGSTSAQYAMYVGGSRVGIYRRRYGHNHHRHHGRYA